MTLKPKGYIPRLIDEQIDLMLRSFGAVCVEGPMWCGKTWTSLNHSNSVIFIGDPSNNYENRRLVKINSEYALNGIRPHLIDEWQEVPSIWDSVRFEVDKTADRGSYILSGSSMPNRYNIMHSGAGRIGSIHMRTMSLFESGDSDGAVSLSSLFTSGFKETMPKTKSLENLIDLTSRGGWPGAMGLSVSEAMAVNEKYILTVSMRNASELDGKERDTRKMMRFIRSLARNESTVVSDRTIKSDMKEYDDESISEATVAEYRDVLDRLFMTEDQSAFNPNLRSSLRVGKTSKRHLCDPSLSIAALGLTPKMLFKDLRTYGFMFESMCERDLYVYAQSNGGKLYHYRDGKGREIDAVVELPDGRWGAFEIKLGTDSIDEAAENLLKIRSFIESDPNGIPPHILCVISGLSSSAYRREDGVFVVPITSLRN